MLREDNVENALNATIVALCYANEFRRNISNFFRSGFPRLLLITLTLVISIGSAANPSSQRAQWWQLRTDTLTAEKNGIASKTWSRWINPVIDENIALSREMAQEYDSIFTEQLSAELIENRKNALFYAAYLDHFLNTYSADSYTKEAAREIYAAAKKEIGNIFSTGDQATIDEILRMTLADRDVKNTSYQHYINLHKSQLQQIAARTAVDSADAKECLSAYAGQIEKNFSLDYTTVTGTTAFSEYSYRVRALKKNFDAIASLYGDKQSDKKILLFTQRTDLLQSDYLPVKNDSPYDVKLFLASAARLRSLYTPKLGSDNDLTLIQEYHTALLASLRAVVDRYKSDQQSITAMHQYAEKESAYIKCISSIKSSDAQGSLATIAATYETAASMRDYLTNLYEKSASVANGAGDALNSKLYTETARHLRYISQYAAPCEQLRAALYGQALREYSLLRENDSTLLASSLASLSAHSRNHAKMTAELGSRDLACVERNELLLAQSEINHLERILDKQIDALESMTLFSEFLQNYSLVYKNVETEVQAQRLSETAKSSFQDGSLIPRLKDADMKMIEEQREARAYLKKNIADDIARLAALGEMYKKKKMPLSFFPDQGKLWLKRQKIEQGASAQIASWQMNEQNYQVIDKKAVALLKSRYERAGYSNPVAEADGTHQISEYGLSFSIPEGWERRDYSKRKEGNLMNFENSLDGSMLMVGGYQPSQTESEIIDRWIREQNLKIVKTGYSEQGSTLYLWKIASDGGNNVAKIMAIHKDGKIILVAGRAPKERYPFFQKRIDAVFNSIR